MRLVLEARSGEPSAAAMIADDCVKEDVSEGKVLVRLFAPEVTGMPEPVVASKFSELKALFDETIECL